MGEVIQFPRRDPPPTISRQVVIYRVQPFWLDRGVPGAGRVREFITEREARVAARALSLRYWRVEVTKVGGFPGSDCWDEPEIIYCS